MRIIDATRRSAIAVSPDRPIAEVAQLMDAATVGAVAVVDDDQLLGIVTDRDLVRRALARRLDANARVDAVMSSPVVTIAGSADLRDAYPVFANNAIRRLAIVDDHQRFVGMVTVDDLVVDLTADLMSVTRPVVAEVLFGHHDAPVPATSS